MKLTYNISVLKKFFIVIFLLFCFIALSAFSYVNTVSANISNGIFRLHVIANSDTAEDQALKYKVRDKLIEYMNQISNGVTSKDDVLRLVYEHKSDFEEIAKGVIKNNGYDYDVNVSIGNFSFPTKTYGDISLPAGFYDALKVEIGLSQGQNWWCVMFPPLCFVDVTTGVVPAESKELMQDELPNEEYHIISEKTPEVKFKFKLLELFTNVANTLTAKK